MDRFLRDLDHPLEPVVEALRRIVRDASPRIGEGVKWNAPSFRTGDWFATPQIPRSSDRVLLVLHTGARAKGLRMQGRIPDPEGFLKWLAPDRCIVTFTAARDVALARAALRTIVRAWIGLLGGS